MGENIVLGPWDEQCQGHEEETSSAWSCSWVLVGVDGEAGGEVGRGHITWGLLRRDKLLYWVQWEATGGYYVGDGKDWICI